MSAITVENVFKTFAVHQQRRRLIRERLRAMYRGNRPERFPALTNVSFRVEANEGVGIIGPNGAGKSTVLGLIAGVSRPDFGTVRVSGRVAPLLELGSGFHPDLTGTENLVLNASLLGLSERQIRNLAPSIIEFAELGEFLREPLRIYSAGMILRLAFSVAIHVSADVLIVDEVLGVGDARFQAKCLAKVRRLREAGQTLLCVSHSLEMITDFCDRAIWLDHGRVIADGPVHMVVNRYRDSFGASAMAEANRI